MTPNYGKIWQCTLKSYKKKMLNVVGKIIKSNAALGNAFILTQSLAY